MNILPERSNIEHLRKQAKDLLRLYKRNDPAALERLRKYLPAARDQSDAALARLQFRLHDMQSCVAREYGFASWVELLDGVELQRRRAEGLDSLRRYWLHLVYGNEATGGYDRPQPARAARLLAERPEIIVSDDPYYACAIGDETSIRRAIERDAEWVNRSGGPLNIAPLIAITHSGLSRLDPFRESLRRCLRLLLDAGADPDQWLAHGDDRLTAIYGAAGKVHDPGMTQMLLAAGANSNDNESLYHSLEDPNPELPCTRLLLEAGTRVGGTNALARVMDFDNLEGLQRLLAYTPRGDEDLDRILLWAIHRGRSAAHARALLDAGANPQARTREGYSALKLALSFGLTEVAKLLEAAGASETLSTQDLFIAACARADESEARRMLAAKPDLIATLSASQLRQLPNLAMAGFDAAVKVMVKVGWPIATRGGDIDGSALNQAVFRGNADLAEFLLEHGASWRERHGYDSDVIGTLSWASINRPRAEGEWSRCAEVLLAHGLPPAEEQPEDPSDPTRYVLIDGRRMTFADDVIDVLVRE
ncbi:MAG: ankyrin repeat domain-containing protein [Steroidobacter sp.]